MKTPINLLTLIFSLSVLAIFLSSCDGDDAVHNFNPNEVFEQSRDSSKHIHFLDEDLIDFENIKDDKLDTELGITLAEALESIDPDVHPNWKVAIKAYTCIRNGQTLLVYNPNDSDLDFYNSSRFSIHWFKDSRPVRGNGVNLECVCKGRYAVIVINRLTKQGIGIAYYSASACFTVQNSVIKLDS